MSEWFFPRITDYSDFEANAVQTNVDRLTRMTSAERRDALLSIKAAVAEHCRVLPDDSFLKAVVAMADDLYKTGNHLEFWTHVHAGYLAHTLAVVVDDLHRRGYSLRYIIDNRFPGGMERPLYLFPALYAAAGLKYVAPVLCALRLMVRDGFAAESFDAHFRQYAAEAQHVGAMLAEKLTTSRASYVCLTADDCESACAPCLASLEKVLLIIREEAPVPGSNVTVRFP